MRRLLKFIGWAIGGLVLLIGLTGMAAYIFATSDFVRAQIENHANAVSGRKTKIARLSVDWGWTPHVHLDDVELSNTDWGKADHMFKAQEIEFDIRLWPLLHGDIVLPRLMLRKPELFLERNAQDESNWSPNESPVANTAVKQVQPQHRHHHARQKDSLAQVGELRADLTMGTWQSRNDMAAGAAEASCQIGRLRRITTGQRHRDLAILMHAVYLQNGDHGDSKQHT